ncbi:MAG: NTP transferase domain-containing protein, partial [Clostridiales Family XIII bacterium]|nr:NTP transferase domain-containing protein [Clostridiales Family XIII bacterium]
MKPKLVIMAAGMGSRFGGLKQLYKITNEGECILDFTLYDAYMAGFRDVVFIIREETKKDFLESFSNTAMRNMNIDFAYQEINDIPDLEDRKSFYIDNRKKPWGTGQALLSAKKYLDRPF